MEFNGYKPGYIYVLKSGPYYKIGYADDVEQRMKSIGSVTGPDLPEPPKVLFTFPTRSKMVAERTLHDFFRRFRVKGEWFQLRERDVETLRRFADGYLVDAFVLNKCKIPDEILLFTEDDIQFCKDFGVRIGDTDPEDLQASIDTERAKRGRAARAKRYQRILTGMLEHMSVEDMEWMMEAVMMRGVMPEDPT